MLVLALDTSLGLCSVALCRDGAMLAEEQEAEHGQQSRRLVLMIESALSAAGVTYELCDAVACTIGPGGFTGIRTGLTTARTITMVTGAPLIGVSTLETIAYGAGIKGDILAAIDAYRGQWYAQRFRMHETLTPQSDALLVDEKALKALSHGAKLVQTLPNAKDAALLAMEKWNRGEREFPTSPLYIREPDAKLPVEKI